MVGDVVRWRSHSGVSRDAGWPERYSGGWAIRFHAYDNLAMINRSAFEHVGGWDTMIPYYGTDCDMHSRLFMSGFKQHDVPVGRIFDVAASLEDVEMLYRRVPAPPGGDASGIPPEDTRGSKGWEELRDALQHLENSKSSGNRLRWQGVQAGGQGEPYYRDAEGFQQSLNMWAEHGKKIMAEKWGHRGCNLKGLKFEDAWMVEHDWK